MRHIREPMSSYYMASYKQLAFEDYSADKIHTLFDIFQYLWIFETTTYYSNS